MGGGRLIRRYPVVTLPVKQHVLSKIAVGTWELIIRMSSS